MKDLRLLLNTIAALVLVAGPLAAHGATYRPPDQGRYGARQNLPTNPYTGYGSGYGSGPGSGRAWPGGPAGAFPATATAMAIDTSDWSWWWDFHKEIYLQLKARLLAGGTASGSDGFFLGRGQKEQSRDDGVRPTREQIRGEIVPALLRLLERDRSQDIRTACLIALARIGEDEQAAQTELVPVLSRYLADPDATVAETAVIALGILGHEASAFPLGELLRDTEAGQDLLGEEEVPVRMRAFAAYALGVLGNKSEREDVRRFIVHLLTRGLEDDDTASSDLSAACVIALGRVPLAPSGSFPDPGPKSVVTSSASLEAQVAYLIELLEDERKLKRFARAHVPTSLGHLASAPSLDGGEVKARVAEALFGRLTVSRREKQDVLQSCAIALGLIGDVDGDDVDVKIRRALIGFPGRIDDRQARNFALMSVGWLAARDGRSEEVGIPELRSHLLRQFATGRGDTPQWAGLALGLVGRAEAARGDIPSTAIVHALHTELKKARSPLEVGAYSIASGLLRDVDAAEPMLDKLKRLKEDRTRGFAAVGLGLLNARDSLETIRRLADEATYRPDLLRELAIALGLLGDRSVVDLLLEKLERSTALSAQASIARALGRIGDRRAVTPLVEMLDETGLSNQARAFAAVALGMVADKDELPWNTVLAVGLNYSAAPQTLFDHQGNGVLNIL